MLFERQGPLLRSSKHPRLAPPQQRRSVLTALALDDAGVEKGRPNIN
jgi:hypothetical protein